MGQEARWEAFCRRLLDEQIAPRFADPLITRAELVDKPLRYLCGSEAELKKVTTWICHCHDDQKTLFAEGQVKITYASRLEDKPSGLALMEHYSLPVSQARGSNFYNPPNPPPCPPHLKTLLDLAFQYNTFEGHSWTPGRGWEHEEACCRKGDWDLTRFLNHATIIRPSAHERAESLLCLFDWLAGKVSPEQRRVLLRLDE